MSLGEGDSMFDLLLSEYNMQLIYKPGYSHIDEAVKMSNQILNSKLFYDKIKEHSSFDNTDLSPKEIADLIEEANQQVFIKTYWRWNPFRPNTCVNATTLSSTQIKVNVRCFSHTLKEAVNTLIHESVHAVDHLNKKWDFTHHDNRNDGDENNTAPWVIGKIAEEMVSVFKN